MFTSPRSRLAKLGIAVSAMFMVGALLGSTSAQAAKSHPFLGSFTGVEAPPEEFSPAAGIAVDPAGYMYITSPENNAIFVYDPSHHYVTTITDSGGPIRPAVDSKGNVYAEDYTGGEKIVVFKPAQYPPTSTTTYAESTFLAPFEKEENGQMVNIHPQDVAVNPTDDHVDIVAENSRGILEFKSAAEGSGLVTESLAATLEFGVSGRVKRGIQIGATGNIYIAIGGGVIGVASPDGTTELHKIENTSRPLEALEENSIAVDQATGNVYVGQTNDVSGPAVVEEFTEDGTLVNEIGPTFDGSKTFEGAFPEPGLAVDNSSGASAGNVYIGTGFFDSEVAEFGPLVELFTLTVTKSGAGTGTVAGASPGDASGIACGTECAHEFVSGATVTLTASPAAGSEFSGWTGSCSGTGPCVVTMSEAKSVGAAFAVAPVRPTLSVSKSGSGSGTVTSAPGGIDCGSTCAASFSGGSSVTLTAAPAAGSEFKGWSGACSGVGTCTVTMSAAESVGAQFDATSSTSVTPVSTSPGPSPTPVVTPKPSPATFARVATVTGGVAQVKVTCPGAAKCAGALKLSAKLKSGKGKKLNAVLIGKSQFSLAAGATGTIKVKLDDVAKKALTDGRKLNATLSGNGIASGTVQLKSKKGK